MSTTTTANNATPAVKLKSVALPTEHGGWGFLLEPILLGLLIAPTLAGLMVAVATVGAFLLRHPLKLIAADRRRGRRFARTEIAKRFAIGYALLALAGISLAVLLAGPDILLPALIAAPFAISQLTYDLRGDSRHWLPELFGPLALGASAAIIALCGGIALPLAMGLWAVIIARALPSILYVRARLRLEKGLAPQITSSILAHAVALLAVIALSVAGLLPALAAAPLLFLLGRAAYGLSSYRRPVAPRTVGFQELAYGILTVLVVAIGSYAGL